MWYHIDMMKEITVLYSTATNHASLPIHLPSLASFLHIPPTTSKVEVRCPIPVRRQRQKARQQSTTCRWSLAMVKSRLFVSGVKPEMPETHISTCYSFNKGANIMKFHEYLKPPHGLFLFALFDAYHICNSAHLVIAFHFLDQMFQIWLKSRLLAHQTNNK